MTVVIGTSTELVRAVVAFDAPAVAKDGRSWPTAPLDDAEFGLLLAQASNERITGHLCHAIERGALPATGEQRAHAARAHRDALVVDVVLERAMVKAVDDLERAGIDVRVLKGAVIAHTVYPAPELR